MSQRSPQPEDRPIVWVVGCAEARKSMVESGLTPRTKRGISHCLQRDGSRPRSIVLHRSAFGPSPIGQGVRAIRRNWPLVDVLLWAPDASGELVRSALRAGVADVVLSRSPRKLAETVAQTIQEQKFLPRLTRTRGGEIKTRFEGLISRSQKMWDLFDLCVKIAPTDANVLIEGETGTGKELIARAIHRRSGRTGRFVPINCGAIPPELVESELFGHEKGAFTGAVTRKDGLFRHAESGTIFLDEIGTIVESTQLRLLRTLQEATVRPVGANEEVPIDVRVVAATSQPLQELVDQQRFRVDLLYRLDVIRLALPALRDRPEDIIFLFAHFALSAAKRYQVERPDVDDRFLDALTAYDWPGNVRQLENFTERLILTHPSPGTLTAEHFDRLIRRDGSRPRPAVPSGNDDAPEPFGRVDTTRELGQALGELVEEAERAYLETCLRENGGRIGETAKHAGISRRTLLRKLRKHGIDKMAFRRR